MTKEDYGNWIGEKRAIFFNQDTHKAVTLIEDEARMEARKDTDYSWHDWTKLTAEAQRRAGFYRGLLDQCAKHLGLDISTVDGSLTQDYPDLEKIPELIEKLVADSAKGR